MRPLLFLRITMLRHAQDQNGRGDQRLDPAPHHRRSKNRAPSNMADQDNKSVGGGKPGDSQINR